MITELLIRGLLGAIGFRGRGGIFNHVACLILKKPTDTKILGTQDGRLIYAYLMAWLYGGMITGYAGLALFLAFFLGTPWKWFESLGLERWYHPLLISFRGLLFVLPAAVILWWAGTAWVPLLVAGLLMGPLYALAHWVPSKVPQLKQGPELGEALAGLVLGLASYLN